MDDLYIAILIDGDLETTLGGCCARDVFNMVLKLLKDTNINKNYIFTLFSNLSSPYANKIAQLGVNNITYSNLPSIKQVFNKVIDIANSTDQNIKLIFHYSGHGYQMRDSNGDEVDSMDEVFLNHTMTDDYIWENLVLKLPSNVRLFGIIDACHSGSGMDLPLLWQDGTWVSAKLKNEPMKCTAYTISACNDSQCSSQDIGQTTGFAGSLIGAFCDLGNVKDFTENPIPLYFMIRHRLKNLGQTVCLYMG